jgi:hypothetical protein
VARPLSLGRTLELVHLHAERGSPKYEKAAMRWIERYLTEGSPRLRHFAEVAAVKQSWAGGTWLPCSRSPSPRVCSKPMTRSRRSSSDTAASHDADPASYRGSRSEGAGGGRAEPAEQSTPTVAVGTFTPSRHVILGTNI